MECIEKATAAATQVTVSIPTSYSYSNSSSSPTNSSLPASPLTPVILSPCAACKILRRRCVEKCVLAPYFPPTEPLKFTTAHRVFGASNIMKLLQELPESQRADAVSSMVYEANARIRDPVYGCAGAICQLQKQVSYLQGELAKTQAELVNTQCQQANLVALICMEMSSSSSSSSPNATQSQPHNNVFHQEQQQQLVQYENNPAAGCYFSEDGSLGPAWEPLWT